MTDTALTLVSLFDGIGGFPLAFSRVGVRTVATVEIDAAAAGVAAERFPHAAHFTDVKEVTGAQLVAAGFDPGRGVIAAGFPCQDLSLAGRRMGLDGARSGLYFEIMRILDELFELTGVRCRWVVLENVPGLLSSVCPCPGGGTCGRSCTDAHTVPGGACGRRRRGDRGRCVEIHGGAMGAVLGELADRRYGYAYRVLDAQHFGVPQRRRRVVIVANPRDWAAPAEVLLEPARRGGDPAAGREARARTATVLAGSTALARVPGRVVGTLPARTEGGGFGWGASEAAAGLLAETEPVPVQNTVIGRSDQAGPAGPGFDRPGAPMFTLDTTGAHAVATSREVVGSLTANMAGVAGVDENTAMDGHLVRSVVNSLGTTSITGVDDSSAQGGHVVAYQGHGSNVGPLGTLRSGSGTVSGGVPFVESDASEVVGPLMSGGTPNGHGVAGINSQAVASGHIVAAVNSTLGLSVGRDEVLPTLNAGNGSNTSGGLVAGDEGQIMPALVASMHKGIGDNGRDEQVIPFDAATIVRPSNRSRPEAGQPTHALNTLGMAHVAVGADLYNGAETGDIAHTLRDGDEEGTPAVLEPMAFDAAPHGEGPIVAGRPVPALNTFGQATVHEPVAFGHTQGIDVQASGDHTSTLRAGNGSEGAVMIPVAPTLSAHDRAGSDGMQADQFAVAVHAAQTIPEPDADAYLPDDRQWPSGNPGAVDPYSGALAGSAVRRLTPVECERLQGYPDGWTAVSAGRLQADSARYKQLGNSIAVPVFWWVALGVVEVDARTGDR